MRTSDESGHLQKHALFQPLENETIQCKKCNLQFTKLQCFAKLVGFLKPVCRPTAIF
jgi:hypothetical protein